MGTRAAAAVAAAVVVVAAAAMALVLVVATTAPTIANRVSGLRYRVPTAELLRIG